MVPLPADAATCFAELRANHIDAEIVPAPPAPLADCAIAQPVRLSSIGLSNGATIDMPDHPILDCAFALTFTEFAQDLMAPLATATLGSGIVALATGGYRCSSPIPVSYTHLRAHETDAQIISALHDLNVLATAPRKIR